MYVFVYVCVPFFLLANINSHEQTNINFPCKIETLLRFISYACVSYYNTHDINQNEFCTQKKKIAQLPFQH